MKLDVGINITHSASRRRSQTNNFHWKTTGKRQEFQVSENGRCQATAVCVIKADKQASSSSGKRINKREEKEAGRYAKQNDTHIQHNTKEKILKTITNSMLAAFQYQFVGMLLMHLVQITIFYVTCQTQGMILLVMLDINNRSQIMMQMLA